MVKKQEAGKKMLATITAQELRDKYLAFFKSKDHKIIPSASLIPENDASVLFNTAGMQPLIPYLSGEKHPQGKRLANIQKCLRTVDFENIGDNIHHTFFQMLGNWSLGDYFKEEAIKWSFEFLTGKKWLNLPLDKLAVTVYAGDDTKGQKIAYDEESYKLWRSLGLPEERIAMLKDDNFWIAGDTGPCGPSTEMFYWTGHGQDAESPKKFDPEDKRWVEIWNDVFMAFHKDEQGNLRHLKNKNVDTGMGLERTLAVLNGQESAYETDLFLPIIKKIEHLSKKSYHAHAKEMRIIADHLRAAVFILGDEHSVVPSNVDRGYILRRLLRRSVRYGKQLGIEGMFLIKVAKEIIANYADSYPELEQNSKKVFQEIDQEEEKFEKTLEKGLREFEKMAKKESARKTEDKKDRKDKKISGQEAFLLFQSYGFPLEMTEELAEENGLKVDTESFFAEYNKHQELSKHGAEKKFKGGLADLSEDTTKLHTATHLLNKALRKIISSDIRQRGSNITPERLRFDFNFDRKLEVHELKAVEDEVNAIIRQGLKIVKKEMSLEEAEKAGAQKEFGHKYPPKVLVYFVGDYSIEVCGGPHVKNTSELGHFKIIKEESSAAGIRRIKAVLSSEPRS